jgi:ADP-ribose pyrophosphatase YjhB (NUDIX family)
MRDTTLLFLIKTSESGVVTDICLAMKKRGFGAGRWNGTGGKTESGETIKDAVVRETQEEIGVTVSEMSKVAELTFTFPHKPEWDQLVHVFFADEYAGTPTESEDMEITFRMQQNFMKIVSAIDAYVETSTPDTVYKLYRQRLRWTQGFLQNSIDYRNMLFKPKYGSIALFTIPVGWLGIGMVIYMFFYYIYLLSKNIYDWFIHVQIIGISFPTLNFSIQDYFKEIYFSTNTIVLLSTPLILSSFVFIIIGHNLSRPESRRWRYIIYFVFLWVFLIPLRMTEEQFSETCNQSLLAYRHFNRIVR